MLHGENFLIDIGDGEAKHGFYSARYVNADNPNHADQVFIDEFRASDKSDELRNLMKNLPDDLPLVTVEEITEYPLDADFENGIIPGLAFYLEDEAD